ncbi:AbrB/MazE/SpoVT family DNA-binding domain-containing protein [Devosia sp.]|uniref:AbrB/MazE/SpoVT family DNA-binding domain-containing protein n=1 Tax=Devosia sp. TaxID=1871048 RepID=UPI003265D56E
MNKIDRLEWRSTVTSRGQTTVPKEIRDTLNVRDGTELVWIMRDGHVTVEPRTRRLVDLAGMLGNPLGRTVSVEEMNEAVLDEAAEQHKRADS